MQGEDLAIELSHWAHTKHFSPEVSCLIPVLCLHREVGWFLGRTAEKGPGLTCFLAGAGSWGLRGCPAYLLVLGCY